MHGTLKLSNTTARPPASENARKAGSLFDRIIDGRISKLVTSTLNISADRDFSLAITGTHLGHPHPFGAELLLMWVKPAALTLFVWTAFGLMQAIPEMIRDPQWPTLVGRLVDAWIWALLTPAILIADRKLTSAKQNVVQLALVHAILSLPYSALHTCLSAIVQYPIASIYWSPFRIPNFTAYYFLSAWMIYCAFAALIQASKFYKRMVTGNLELERVEKRLIESRLDALRLQLEPHFLFNTLNAISSEVACNPALAREMIEDLGALLRRSLDSHGSPEVSLAQELAMLDHYLSIQKLRFGDRVSFQIDVDPAALSALVPSMLLQPLIENAIRHGLEGSLSGGLIIVAASRRDDHLLIKVGDDGAGLPPNWRMDISEGIGLRVTRERLEGLYPANSGHSFTVSPRAGGGTEVLIRIPLSSSAGEADAFET